MLIDTRSADASLQAYSAKRYRQDRALSLQQGTSYIERYRCNNYRASSLQPQYFSGMHTIVEARPMHTANESLAPHAGRFSTPTWATSKRSPNYRIERLEDATTLRNLSSTHASSQKTTKVETRQGNLPRKTSTPRHSRNHWRPTSLRPIALPRN